MVRDKLVSLGNTPHDETVVEFRATVRGDGVGRGGCYWSGPICLAFRAQSRFAARRFPACVGRGRNRRSRQA